MRPSDALSSPSENRGRRECRVHDAPTALRAKGEDAREANTGTPKSPGTPCAMVLRLLRDLPGDPSFSPPAPATSLARLSPELAGQDHPVDPSESPPPFGGPNRV